MSSKKAVAVLGIGRATDYKKVLTLAQAVASALTLNATTYSAPDPTVVAILAQVAILQGYINEVEDGDHSKKDLRDEASETLYAMLQQGLVYVNKIGNHDRGILALSGYPVSAEPAPRPIPEQVVIKRIVDGKESNSAKIYIDPIGQTDVRFEIQATTTPDVLTSWHEVLGESNSFQLIISNLVLDQKVWYRVRACNANGNGAWSVAVSFISQR